jgi:hypothetical protein
LLSLSSSFSTPSANPGSLVVQSYSCLHNLSGQSAAHQVHPTASLPHPTVSLPRASVRSPQALAGQASELESYCV